MLTVLCADKGSPGVTSSALALAACWPNPRVLLVEADPSGGDLAIILSRGRQPLPSTVTVATVAAATRDGGAESLAAALPFADGVEVIPGFLSTESGAGVADLWTDLTSALTSSGREVIVDAGRLSSASPLADLARRADTVVAVAGQSMSALIHLRERIRLVRAMCPRARIVPLIVSAERDGRADRDTVDDLLSGLEVDPAAHLAWDPTGLAGLCAGSDPRSRSMRRRPIVRSATSLATALAGPRAAQEAS